MSGRARPGTAHDASAIAATEAAAAHRPWGLADVEHHLGDPARCTLVAELDGQVIGHALASFAVDQGELLTIAVHPTARRRGLGGELLSALIATWASLGVDSGWLEVRVDNVAAIALYRAHDWEEVDRRKGYYHDGVDALVMRREVC